MSEKVGSLLILFQDVLTLTLALGVDIALTQLILCVLLIHPKLNKSMALAQGFASFLLID